MAERTIAPRVSFTKLTCHLPRFPPTPLRVTNKNLGWPQPTSIVRLGYETRTVLRCSKSVTGDGSCGSITTDACSARADQCPADPRAKMVGAEGLGREAHPGTGVTP